MAAKYGGWCKDEQTHTANDGKEFCVFHAPAGTTGIAKQNFESRFFEKTYKIISWNEDTKHVKTSCDFSGTIFKWELDLRRFDKHEPLPEINLNYANFIKGVICFDVCFGDEAYFYLTHFADRNTFEGATFRKDVYFQSATFLDYEGAISFKGAVFEGIANFEEVGSLIKMEFNAAIFNKHVSFADSQFENETTFNGVSFKGEADFRRAYFQGKTSFDNSSFEKTSFFQSIKFPIQEHGIFNKEVSMHSLRISECIRFEGANLSKISFLDTDMRKLELVNCTFSDKPDEKILYDEIRPLEENERLEDRQSKVETLYRQLKQKAKADHNEAEASEWHFREKEMRRQREGWKGDFLLSLYWLTSGYAERALQAGLFLALMIALYTLIPDSNADSTKNIIAKFAGSITNVFHDIGVTLAGGGALKSMLYGFIDFFKVAPLCSYLRPACPLPARSPQPLPPLGGNPPLPEKSGLFSSPHVSMLHTSVAPAAAVLFIRRKEGPFHSYQPFMDVHREVAFNGKACCIAVPHRTHPRSSPRIPEQTD